MAKILAAGGAPAKTRTKTAAKPAKKRSKATALPVKKAFVKKRFKYPTKAEIERARIALAKIADEFEAKQAALGIVEPEPEVVPLAEVEALAAKAVKLIKAKRSLSAERKAGKLKRVAETLESARRQGGLPKHCAWWLANVHDLNGTFDKRAVMR